MKDIKFETVFLCFIPVLEDQGAKHANVEKLKLSELLSVNKLMNDSLTMLKTRVVFKRIQPAGGSSGSAEKEQKVPGPLREPVDAGMDSFCLSSQKCPHICPHFQLLVLLIRSYS